MSSRHDCVSPASASASGRHARRRRRLSIWLKPRGPESSSFRIRASSTESVTSIFFGASDNAVGGGTTKRRFVTDYRPKGRSEEHRDAALCRAGEVPPDPIGIGTGAARSAAD